MKRQIEILKASEVQVLFNMNTYNFIGTDKSNKTFQIDVNANNEKEAWNIINNYLSLDLDIQLLC